MENKNNLDLMLEIIDFNKKKYKVIMDMLELELDGKLGKEYADLIKSYEVISWYIDKELVKCNADKKDEILSRIVDINPTIGRKIPFMDIIQNKENNIHLQRTISDFGAKYMDLYHTDNACARGRNSILRLLGFDVETENYENENFINSYMVYDFNNMMLSVIMDDLKKISSNEAKKALLKLKYNLIYISDDLEERARKTKFLLPNKPSLVDETTIKTSGITKEDYLHKSDIVFSGWLENAILEAVDKVYKKDLVTVHYLDHVLIKTLASLISDKELCSYLVLEPTDKMLPNVRRATVMINSDLVNSEIDTTDRKIMRI